MMKCSLMWPIVGCQKNCLYCVVTCRDTHPLTALSPFSSLSIAYRAKLQQAARSRMTEAFRPGTRVNKESHLMFYTVFAVYFGYRNFMASTATMA